MARLTTEQKEFRDLIKRLTEQIKTERAADRTAAKAEALANRPPPLSHSQVRLNELRTVVARHEANLSSKDMYVRCKAQAEIDPARMYLACHARDFPTTAADLLPWALKYLADYGAHLARYTTPPQRI